MSRLVASRPPVFHLVDRAADPGAPAAAASSRDDYLSKVAKYIPVEFVGGYLFFQKLISFEAGEPHDSAFQMKIISICAFTAILWLLIPLYFRYQGAKEAAAWQTQAVISLIAFPIWLYAIGGSLLAALLTLVPADSLSAALLTSSYLPAGILVLFSIVSGCVDQ